MLSWILSSGAFTIKWNEYLSKKLVGLEPQRFSLGKFKLKSMVL